MSFQISVHSAVHVFPITQTFIQLVVELLKAKLCRQFKPWVWHMPMIPVKLYRYFFFSLKKNENLKMTLISQDYMGHFCWMVFKPPLEPAWHHLPRLHSGKHCYTVEETAKGMTRRLWEAIPISLLCQFVLPLKPKYSPNPPSLPAQLFYPPQSPRGPIPKTYFHLNFT